MRLLIHHTQEVPPAMPRLRTPDGSTYAWTDDADLVIDAPVTTVEHALILRRPHYADATLARGTTYDLSALSARLLCAIGEAEGSDTVDVGALVGGE